MEKLAYTRAEAAAALGCGVGQVDTLRREGRLKVVPMASRRPVLVTGQSLRACVSDRGALEGDVAAEVAEARAAQRGDPGTRR